MAFHSLLQSATREDSALALDLLQPLGIPVPGYVVQTDDGTNILVDSGFPQSFIEHPSRPQGPLSLPVEMHPEDWVVNRLASIGLQPDDSASWSWAGRRVMVRMI